MRKLIAIILFSLICNNFYAANAQEKDPTVESAFDSFLKKVSSIHTSFESIGRRNLSERDIDEIWESTYRLRDTITAFHGLSKTPENFCTLGDCVQLSTGKVTQRGLSIVNFEPSLS